MRSVSKTACRRRVGRPIPSPGAAAPAHPRIAAVRRASWTAATKGFHSMRLRAWTPWSSSPASRAEARSTKRRAGGWRMPWSGPRLGSKPRVGHFRGGKSTPVFAMASTTTSCTSSGEALRSAAVRVSPRRAALLRPLAVAGMPAINAWAVGSVSWPNLRCSVAAVVSA